MLEADFIEYCERTLTTIGFPLAAQKEIMELGFRRHMMIALRKAVRRLLPVETAQRGVLQSVLEEYMKQPDCYVPGVVEHQAVPVASFKSTDVGEEQEAIVGNSGKDASDQEKVEQEEVDAIKLKVDVIRNKVGNEKLVEEELARNSEEVQKPGSDRLTVEGGQTPVKQLPSSMAILAVLDPAAVEEVKDVLFGIIDGVVRGGDGNVPVIKHAPAAPYNYRQCLVDKREALENPTQLEGKSPQVKFAAAKAHFEGSTLANHAHLSRIVHFLKLHIYVPATESNDGFPYEKNLAAPCTKRMYTEWNLAVNRVAKKDSSEEFMKWKNAGTAEYHQWEELKGAVDHFILEQIRLGITTGEMEKKPRNKRQADYGGDARPAKKRAKTVEDEDSMEEPGPSSREDQQNSGPAKKRARLTAEDDDKPGPSGAAPSQKEKVEKMRHRYGKLNN